MNSTSLRVIGSRPTKKLFDKIYRRAETAQISVICFFRTLLDLFSTSREKKLINEKIAM